MEQRVIRGSRLKSVALFVISLAFVVLGVWLVVQYSRDTPVVIVESVGICFFGLGLLISVWQIIRPQTLVLDREGFSFSSGMSSFRRLWSDVDRFFVFQPTTRSSLVGWNYLPGRGPSTLIAKISRSMGADAGLPSGWSISTQALVDLMNSYRERA